MAGINGEDPDTLFLKFNIYDNMCNLKREDGVPIRDFIHEFETKYFKFREEGIWMPDYIAGFMLLSSCMLPEEKIFLVMSAIYSEVNYDSMKTTIMTVFSQEMDTDDVSSSEDESVMESEIRVEPLNELDDGEESDGDQSRKRLRMDTSLSTSEGIPNKRKRRIRLERRTPTCLWCDSTYRWCWECKCGNKYECDKESMRPLILNRKLRYKSFRDSEKIHFAFMCCEGNQLNDNDRKDMMHEFRGCAILDSGCPTNVCGQEWLDSFMEDMRDEECLQVKIKFCNQKFIFGNGKTVVSKKRVTVPCWIGEMRERVCINVVDYNIPLLLSRKAMKAAGMVLDFREDELLTESGIIKLRISRSGHYALPVQM